MIRYSSFSGNILTVTGEKRVLCPYLGPSSQAPIWTRKLFVLFRFSTMAGNLLTRICEKLFGNYEAYNAIDCQDMCQYGIFRSKARLSERVHNFPCIREPYVVIDFYYSFQQVFFNPKPPQFHFILPKLSQCNSYFCFSCKRLWQLYTLVFLALAETFEVC